MLVKFTSGQAGIVLPRHSVVYILIVRGRKGMGRWSLSFFSSWVDVTFSSSVPPPDRAGKFICPSLYGQARTVVALWEKYFQVSVQWESFILKSQLLTKKDEETSTFTPPLTFPGKGHLGFLLWLLHSWVLSFDLPFMWMNLDLVFFQELFMHCVFLEFVDV